MDVSRRRSSITSPLINALSDHDAQLLTIKNIHTANKKASLKQKTRLINSETLTNFQTLLKQETWGTVYQTQDTTNMFNSFLNTFLKIFETCFPVKYRSTKEEKKKNDWITQGIKISCKPKRSLYTLIKNNNNPKIKAHYIKYSRILKRVIKEAKNNTIADSYQNLIIKLEQHGTS